jgi:hypothetical protein
MLYPEVAPPQLVPGAPFARLKLSNTLEAGKPEEEVAVMVGMFVCVGVGVWV